MTAPKEVRDAARRAYIDHEGYGTRAGHDAAADVAYAAGIAAGRRQAADEIEARAASYDDATATDVEREVAHGLRTAAAIARGKTGTVPR